MTEDEMVGQPNGSHVQCQHFHLSSNSVSTYSTSKIGLGEGCESSWCYLSFHLTIECPPSNAGSFITTLVNSSVIFMGMTSLLGQDLTIQTFIIL